MTKDTSELVEELRALVRKRNLALFDITIRINGWAISYAEQSVTHIQRTGRYYPTLRCAVEKELLVMKKLPKGIVEKGQKSKRQQEAKQKKHDYELSEA